MQLQDYDFLEIMKTVVNGEKLEAEPYIRTTHPTQTKSKYFGEELQCSSIPQFKLISRLNLAFFSGLKIGDLFQWPLNLNRPSKLKTSMFQQAWYRHHHHSFWNYVQQAFCFLGFDCPVLPGRRLFLPWTKVHFLYLTRLFWRLGL